MESNVVLAARSERDLQAVAQGIKSAGGSALVVAGDVSQTADCQRLVAETVQAFGQIDAVVNNAGVLAPIASIADGDPQQWKKSWAVNLLGPFMLTQAALPHLRQSRGRVVNVSAGAAVNVYPAWAAYSSAKAGLNHFTRILAAEEPEITAIAFRPGVIDTAMQAHIRREGADSMPDEIYARFVGLYEQQELLPPEVPACALAVLAFHAPHDWSGGFLPWNHKEVQSLVRQFACSPGPQDKEVQNA
jgi:NAD(P)-dependent dehydrogenase (short-subunit alcohol dehydrogenase family)